MIAEASCNGPDVLHVQDRAYSVADVADREVEREAPAIEAHLELVAWPGTTFDSVEVNVFEVGGAAVFLANHYLVSYVDELAGQVTGVSCTQSSVGAALAGSVRRDEVLEHVEALTEVSADRQLDGVTRGVRHQATH